MEMLETLINTPEDLVNYFDIANPSKMQKKILNRGVLVNTKVRRDFMTSQNQGIVLVNHRHHSIEFDNKGGGVWLAKLDKQL